MRRLRRRVGRNVACTVHIRTDLDKRCMQTYVFNVDLFADSFQSTGFCSHAHMGGLFPFFCSGSDPHSLPSLEAASCKPLLLRAVLIEVKHEDFDIPEPAQTGKTEVARTDIGVAVAIFRRQRGLSIHPSMPSRCQTSPNIR